MALSESFNFLEISLRQLEERLSELAQPIHEAVEVRGQHPDQKHPVEEFKEAVSALLDRTRETIVISETANAMIAAGGDLRPVIVPLVEIHEFTLGIAQDCFREVTSHRTLKRLEKVAHDHQQWRRWLEAIQRYLSPSVEAVHTVQGAVIPCWRDLADRLTTPVVIAPRVEPPTVVGLPPTVPRFF